MLGHTLTNLPKVIVIHGGSGFIQADDRHLNLIWFYRSLVEFYGFLYKGPFIHGFIYSIHMYFTPNILQAL